ncbi:Serine/threonine-protein phosphatase [Aphelenchoides besseyi]|nr:Serine/threonine-protein phosphatase [Aphelenchoides besseyi]KAI6225554.1 Serine/threonine-protein phosphatase [Aphelenchoides besseyi]
MSARRVEIEAFIKKHYEFVEDRLQYDVQQLLGIVREAKDLISAEPTLVEVKLPVLIVGDIHGQYKDLLRMFATIGKSGINASHSHRFLFLGDYVDRGRNSLECITLLVAYKLAFPRMYNLLRGNHESSPINRAYGFFQELQERFSESDAETIWRAFNDLFAFLPIAALVQNRILCMHGGLSSHLNSLDDIRNIKRPLEDPSTNPLACDLLWSDPMVDLAGYQPNTVRGVSVYFGEDEVLKTLDKLKLELMMLNGYGFFCRRKLVTVFSAPRYYPEKNNKGAVMSIAKNLRIGFFILNPVCSGIAGQEKFLETYSRVDDDPSYITRTAALEGALANMITAETTASSQKSTNNNKKGSNENKKGSSENKKGSNENKKGSNENKKGSNENKKGSNEGGGSR